MEIERIAALPFDADPLEARTQRLRLQHERHRHFRLRGPDEDPHRRVARHRGEVQLLYVLEIDEQHHVGTSRSRSDSGRHTNIFGRRREMLFTLRKSLRFPWREQAPGVVPGSRPHQTRPHSAPARALPGRQRPHHAPRTRQM